MTVRGRHVDRPVAGTAHVGFTALLDALKGALRPLVVVLAVTRTDQLAELVVEAFGVEIALLLGNPLLQPKVRFDDELAHGGSSCDRKSARPFDQVASNPISSAPSPTCSPPANPTLLTVRA